MCRTKLVNDRFASWFPVYEVGANYGPTPATGGVATLIRRSNDVENMEHMRFATGRVLRTTVHVKGSVRPDQHKHILWNIHDEDLDQTDVHAVHDAIFADIAVAQEFPELCTVIFGGDINAMPPDDSRVLVDSAANMHTVSMLPPTPIMASKWRKWEPVTRKLLWIADKRHSHYSPSMHTFSRIDFLFVSLPSLEDGSIEGGNAYSYETRSLF